MGLANVSAVLHAQIVQRLTLEISGHIQLQSSVLGSKVAVCGPLIYALTEDLSSDI